MGLILALDHHVSRLAILIAASTSVADALVESRPGVNPREFIRVFPRESAVAIRAAMSLARTFPRSPLQAAVSAHNGTLADAKSATLSYLQSLNTSLSASDPGLLELAQSWRLATAMVQVALTELGHLLEVHRARPARRDQWDLTKILLAAVRGEAPLVTRTGSVAVPGWADHRGDLRASTNLPARLVRGGRSHAISVRDMSNQSLGIDGAPDLCVGETVDLIVADYLRVGARVIWCDQGRAGLALARPLTGPWLAGPISPELIN